MEQTQICRLCLQNVPKFDEITNYLKRKIVFISSQHKIHICPCCKWYACYNCVQELDSCCNFKQTLVETEGKILNVVRHQPAARNLKSMLNIDDPKQDTKICRLCLKSCNKHSFNLFQSNMNIMPFESIKRVCDDIFSMDLNLSDEPIMCYPCWESLQKTHNLIKALLKTQLAINNFLGEKKINKLKSEDLKNVKIIEDNVPKGQIQYIKEIIDTECMVKEEETNSSINNVKKEELSPKQNKIDCEKEPHLTDLDDVIELSSSCESDVEPVQTSSEAITCKSEDLVVEENYIVNNKIKLEIDNVDSSDCQYKTDSVHGLDTSSGCDTGNKEDDDEIKTKTVKISEERGNEIVANATIFDESAQVYRCKKCYFTTRFRRGVLPHVRKHERGAINLDCHRCRFSAPTSQKLKAHMLTHAPPIVKAVCKDCKMTFKTKIGYTLHAFKMHPNKHRCTVCDYATSKKTDLNKHMKRHPQTRVLSCSVCGKKFFRKGTLRKHTLSKHGNQVS